MAYPTTIKAESIRAQAAEAALQATIDTLTSQVSVLATKLLSISKGGGSGGIATSVVTTLTNANSAANFLTQVANTNIDVIELAAGNYTWQGVNITTDRTSRPLTIRPVSGATVNFVGPATSDGSIFDLTGAKYITFDGSSGTMVFKDFALAQSGVFQPSGTDHCTFKYLTFSNLSRDAGFSDQPYKSWCFYTYGSTNDHMLVDFCHFQTPNAHRDISAFQIASSGSHGDIRLTNVVEMDGYLYAFYCERPVTNVVLDTWTMSDCGNTSNNKSIDFIGAVSMAGSYSNIHATTSKPYSDTHSGGGTITNGGGNSGI